MIKPAALAANVLTSSPTAGNRNSIAANKARHWPMVQSPDKAGCAGSQLETMKTSAICFFLLCSTVHLLAKELGAHSLQSTRLTSSDGFGGQAQSGFTTDLQDHSRGARNSDVVLGETLADFD